MTALLRNGNAWQHPDFDVTINDDGEIVTDIQVPLKPIDTRDLVQALTEAIQAAEAAEGKQ